MSADTLERETTNAARVYGEPWAVVPHFVLFAEGVSPTAKLLWITYQTYAHFEGGIVPKVETIANRMGVSVRTVQRAREELEAADLLRVEVQTRKDGSQTTNKIHLRSVRGATKMTSPNGCSEGDTSVIPRGVTNVTPVVKRSLEVINPSVGSPTDTPPTEHATRRTRHDSPRRLGDDRTAEHAPVASRREPQDAPHERQPQRPDPPRVPLYAERANDPTVIHTTDGDYPYAVPLDNSKPTPDERALAIRSLKDILARHPAPAEAPS